MRTYAIPEYITSDELKELRNRIGLTQKEFAELIGVSKPTVERWETSERITGPVVLLTKLLDEDIVEDLKIPERSTPLRLWYMHKNTLCTIIDVDVPGRKIKIKNFVDHMQFRAFGLNTKPTYSDYEEFIKSRCFPETRDKMKLILKDLNLPFYDPFMIIQKTEGRMAEDNFWIKVEK